MYEDYDERGYNSRPVWQFVLVALCLVALLAGMAYRTYNQLVDKAEDVKLAESNVETLMQRRLELIPDLVATVKNFTKHEEQVFRDIDNARAALQVCLDNNDVEQLEEANKELNITIDSLKSVVVENYPELASSKAYTALMDQLEGSVNRIAVAREDYNEAVSAYNRAIKHFPTSIFASLFGYEEIDPFQADDDAHQNNMVDFG